MQSDFDVLKSFDFTQGQVYLWIFKRSTKPCKFNAQFVPTADGLNSILQDVISTQLTRITEFSPYTYLAETNDGSCLTSTIDITDFRHLKTLVDRPEPDCILRGATDLVGADGYVVKYIHNNQVIYAVKRTTRTWKPAYTNKIINMIFKNGEMSAAEDNEFSIERSFDFYCVNTSMFISSKRNFESAMSFRTGFSDAFLALQASNQFSGVFTNLQPLVDYVGSNSIHLRRMATVQQKKVYEQPQFLTRLKQVSQQRRWNLNFDPHTNCIIPCEQTARTIMQVLLDHRLLSEVTENSYDVPDAVQIH